MTEDSHHYLDNPFQHHCTSGSANKVVLQCSASHPLHRPVPTVNIGPPVTLLPLGAECAVARTRDPGNHASIVTLVEPAAVGGVRDVGVRRSGTRDVDDGAGCGWK